jgi:hypothetical protein
MEENSMAAEDMTPELKRFALGEWRTLNLKLTEPVPDPLFVCSAKIREDVAGALEAKFDRGTELPGDLKAKYNSHLSYSYGLSEQFYEAGPSADFTELIYMYNTQSMEEAKKLMEADPFHKEGIFYDDWWFEWFPHSPMYKGGQSSLMQPWRTVDVVVEMTTPKTLIASFGKFDLGPTRDWEHGKATMPLFVVLHGYNRYAEGGLSTMGLDWGCGATWSYDTGDTGKVLHILAVPNIETAKLFNETDAFYRWGLMSDFRYFEWCIHYPVRKVNPFHRHKDPLHKVLEGAGIVVPKE